MTQESSITFGNPLMGVCKVTFEDITDRVCLIQGKH